MSFHHVVWCSSSGDTFVDHQIDYEYYAYGPYMNTSQIVQLYNYVQRHEVVIRLNSQSRELVRYYIDRHTKLLRKDILQIDPTDVNLHLPLYKK